MAQKFGPINKIHFSSFLHKIYLSSSSSNHLMKGLLVGKKFVLLSRRSNLKRESKKALDELLLVSPRLLKEIFGHLWEYKSRTWAMKFF